jgi:hypothetical protein
MASHARKPGWIFYVGWIVASAAGVPIAWTIAWAIISRAVGVVGARIEVGGYSRITEDFLGLYVLLPVLGLLLGLLQYLLLRRYLPRIVAWIAATTAGWLSLSALLGIFAFVAVAPPAPLIVLAGGFLALPQWFVLRTRVPNAVVWLIASTVSWALAFVLNRGRISNQGQVLTVLLLPPVVASIAWWLLLDWLPRRDGAAFKPSLPLGAR